MKILAIIHTAVALAGAAQAYAHRSWQYASASSYSVHDSGSRQGCPGAPSLTDGALTVATFAVPCWARLQICLGSRCVVATRTDSGPYAPGRLFDLNAGVVHALIGSWSPAVWGVRVVRWRRAG